MVGEKGDGGWVIGVGIGSSVGLYVGSGKVGVSVGVTVS